MKKIKKFKIRSYFSLSGTLIPISFGNQFPIKVKRLFFLYGKKNNIRGEHAHKKCSQFFFPICGKFILKIKTPKIEKKIILNHSSKIGVMVPPKYWCSIKFTSNNSILMVACDHYYNFNDYLRTFGSYKKYLRIK